MAAALHGTLVNRAIFSVLLYLTVGLLPDHMMMATSSIVVLLLCGVVLTVSCSGEVKI